MFWGVHFQKLMEKAENTKNHLYHHLNISKLQGPSQHLQPLVRRKTPAA